MPAPVKNANPDVNTRVFEDMIEDEEVARMEAHLMEHQRAGKLPTGKHKPHADRSVHLN
jgi:hypothetical protein